MVDPVSDVEQVRVQDTDDADAEEASKPDPARRSQLTLVVLVVVLYLACQTLVIYLIKNNKSVKEYSDDVSFPHDLSSARIKSDLEYMKRFCDQPDIDQHEKENFDREAGFDSVKTTDSSFLSSHVLSVMKKRLTTGDLWCRITVTYYVCDLRLGPHSHNYNLKLDGSIVVEQRNESSPLTERITFVDESLGFDIVIAYSVCPDDVRPEKITTIPNLFIEVIKIVSPLPILSTLVVYFYLPQLQNLQGKIIICKLLSGLVYSSSPLFVNDDEPHVVLVCSCVAEMTWTSILCYDLWSAFSDCLPTSRRPGNGQKFVRYSLIGWGHPTSVGLVIILAELNLSAWFEYLLGCILYVIYMFLNVLNMLFFTFTVKNIKQHNTRHLSLVKSGRQGKTAANGLHLYFKISALMGIISFVFQNVDICMIIFVKYNDKIFDAALISCSFLDNMLYFIILVCNKRVLRLLENKWKSKSIN